MVYSESECEDSVRTVVPIILFGSLVFVAIIYANATNPELFTDLKQQLGIAEPVPIYSGGTAPPVQRNARIDALLIADANKRDLKSGLAFWGAAPHMLELAFNDRSDSVIVNIRDGVPYEFYSFQHTDKRGEVMYEFKDSKLICAHTLQTQRSDCANGESSYYGTQYPFTNVNPNN